MTRAIALLLLLVPALGCREETAMLVFVDTDVAAIETIQVLVEHSDGTTETRRTEGSFQMLSRPVRLTLVAEDEPVAFTVTVSGLDAGDGIVLTQRAETRFEKNETLFLRMYLYSSCLGVTDCPTDETCDQGVCIPAARSGSEYDGDPDGIDPMSLVDAGVDAGGACDPSTCWEGCPSTGPCDPVAELVAGGAHSCARTEGGDVYCWGDNALGQLGNGTMGGTPRPSRVALPAGGAAIDVSAGLDHTCAVVDPGPAENEIWCWGDNADGQLGTSVVTGSTATPVIAEGFGGLGGIGEVAAGGQHTCILARSDGAPAGDVWCTGNDDAAQLGSMVVGSTSIFMHSTTYLDASGIAAGDQHTCFIHDGPRAVCWGESDSGRLGNGVSGSAERNPQAVLLSGSVEATGVELLAAGHSHTCLRTSASEVRCFGQGDHGQLGAGLADGLVAETQPESSPGAVLGDWSAVAAGFLQTCGIRQAEIWCWGWSNDGALGVGDGSNEQPPQPVARGARPAGAEASLLALGGGVDPVDSLENVTHACALVAGIVYCWGDNAQGQVDSGAAPLVLAPARVQSP